MEWVSAPNGPCGDGIASRQAGRAALAEALQASRATTLALFDAYEQALPPGLPVPRTPELNPPLWELGHIGWFADWWIARHPHWHRGLHADPEAPRRAARQARDGIAADALYHSGQVAHETRWALPLPDAHRTREHLAASLSDTLDLLRQAPEDDNGLYFFRLALFHEDMHIEAFTYMAQTLGLPLPAALLPGHHRSTTTSSAPLHLPAQTWRLGHTGPGFAFDNEREGCEVAVPATEIDAEPVCWARYLPFVETGGYDDPACWDTPGWAWRQQTGAQHPRHLRRDPGSTSGWARQRFGRWEALHPLDTACHLSAHEARAWCRWAGRQLPTEAQWECAAHTLPGFVWGSVWEWTASPFEPYPGFTPHPYRDYSQPWFDGRPVLRGASWATTPRMRHAHYRNYFTPERNDILAGLRSVAA